MYIYMSKIYFIVFYLFNKTIITMKWFEPCMFILKRPKYIFWVIRLLSKISSIVNPTLKESILTFLYFSSLFIYLYFPCEDMNVKTCLTWAM